MKTISKRESYQAPLLEFTVIESAVIFAASPAEKPSLGTGLPGFDIFDW